MPRAATRRRQGRRRRWWLWLRDDEKGGGDDESTTWRSTLTGSRRKNLLDPYILSVFLFIMFNMRVYDVTNRKVAPSRGSRRKTLLDPCILVVCLFLTFNMRVYDVTNSKVAPSRGSRQRVPPYIEYVECMLSCVASQQCLKLMYQSSS